MTPVLYADLSSHSFQNCTLSIGISEEGERVKIFLNKVELFVRRPGFTLISFHGLKSNLIWAPPSRLCIATSCDFVEAKCRTSSYYGRRVKVVNRSRVHLTNKTLLPKVNAHSGARRNKFKIPCGKIDSSWSKKTFSMTCLTVFRLCFQRRRDDVKTFHAIFICSKIV